ncbi:YidC/Oxa1 family membrane protein insertase [Lawsonibacter celer]|uniref:YidC/Oxa1 family membrane protein insertase n=1 Tax=Lawsonibacter celer TaxID=2986526 RepID=UPI0016475B4C|nr:YidC/Oxa1 family membrane protein insertase [Lawsonibacter celer]
MNFAQIILTPFVWLLTAFYNLTGSYGLALILFALVVKLILFPFSLKGKRSMIQMNMLSGKMQKLQKQYGKDRERYNMEVQKLYEKEKVNPMGGCLWSFIPLLILLPLYAIIRRPLFYTMGLTAEQIAQVAQALDWSHVAVDMGWVKTAADTFTSGGYNELFLASLINENTLASVQGISSNIFALNFNFLGLDLSQIPQLKFWLISGGFGLFIMPIISAVTGFLFSMISMRTNAVNSQSAAAQNSTSKTMMIVSPLISLWIGFSMPAALCLYWIANNVLSMLQEVICGKLLKKDYEKAAALRAEQERLEKEEEKAERRRKAEERARRAEEERLNKGKRKKEEREEDDRIPGSVKEASRVGIRQYARGRAYDPNRYGAPTPYTEYVAPKAPEKGKKRKEQEDAAPVQEQPAAVPAAPVREEPTVIEPAPDTPAAPIPAEPAAGEVPVSEEEAEAPYAEESETDDTQESEKTE